MNNKCPECGMDFRQEPGFYLGAAVISYAMQAILLFLTFFIFQVLFMIPLWYFIGLFSGILVLLVPFTFRISRLSWINMMGKRPVLK